MGALPEIRVEVAFDSGVRTPTADRTWTDISDYVELDRGISITGGRSDERSVCEANALTGLVLDNTDGRFTPELSSSPYYPGVKLGRPFRVIAELPGGDADLFFGFVDEWSVEWSDETSATAYATVTASSRLARLGEGVELRSLIEEEYALDGPVAHYTLGESEGATRAADSSGNHAPALVVTGTGTAPTFGNATGPGTDDLTAVTLNAGQHLQGAVDGSLGAVSFYLTTSTNDQSLFSIALTSAAFVPRPVYISAAGKVVVRAGSSTLTSATTVTDGGTHHVVILSDGATFTSIYVDGVEDATTAAFVWGGTREVYLGVTFSDPTFSFTAPAVLTGSVSHFALWPSGGLPNDARIAAHAAAGSTGFADELAAARIERYATYADIPAAEVDSDAGAVPLSHIDTTGRSVVDVLRIVETTDGGVLFDARDGSLTYQEPGSRYQAASAFTIAAATQQLDGSMRPVLDHAALLNDVTAKNLTGTVTARVTDEASIEDNGVAGAEVEVATTDDDEPYQAAARRVNRYAEPRLRVPTLAPVDILTLDAALMANLVAADVGTRFTVTGQPSQAPTSSADYFIEGYVDTIGLESWQRSFNVSPAALFDAWLLNSATRSQLDTTTVLG